MHIDKKKLGLMAWYRLTKVIYFVLLAILIIFSILIALSEPFLGIGSLACVVVVGEVVRQLFFYVVTGEFLSSTYKANLIKATKVLVVILIGALVIFLVGKAINKVSASMCTSKLGNLSTYENGTCECIYGYTIENEACISNDDICQRTLGENSTSVGEGCACLTGYAEINGTCSKIDDVCAEQFGNAEGVPWENDKCRCKTGYQWNEKRDYCVKIEPPKPPKPPQLSDKEKCDLQGYRAKFNVMSNVCECTFDFVKIDGVCQSPPYCGQNAHYDERQKCICNSGFKKEGDTCIKPSCPLYSSYNSNTDKCECDAFYVPRDGVCKSVVLLCGGLLGKYNPYTGDCVECPYGYELKGRDCVYKDLFNP